MEREYERRRVEGDKWRTAREDETLFDEEAAKRHPYELTQTRQRCEMTVTIPVPAKTRACHVRVKIQKQHLSVGISTHPLGQLIHGELFKPVRRRRPDLLPLTATWPASQAQPGRIFTVA